MTLRSVLTRDALRLLAGERSFSRGAAYSAEMRVEGLCEDGESILAEVNGTHEYHVELWAEDGTLQYDCDCPVGMDGACCKHCVAVGLAWLEQQSGAMNSRSACASSAAVSLDDVRAYLRTLTPDALVELMMAQVKHDADLREQLLLRVARTAARGIDLSTYRRAIDRAIGLRDFIDYGGAHAYAAGIERVLESLAELLQDGHAEEALSMIEYAVEVFDRSIGMVDDSDGYLTPLIERIEELHYTACVAVQPDPEALARRLCTWAMENDFLTFSGGAAQYADLLGEAGLAVYREQVEAVWAVMPVLAPGEAGVHGYDGKRWRVSMMMESLALAAGDVDAVVAVKSRDLSHAYAFYLIAQLYQEAGRHDDALAWAERGLQAFPANTDWRLRYWLVDEYHRRGRHDDAMALIWQAFTEYPELAAYQALQAHAARLGQWDIWRERAWALLRAQAARTNAEAHRYGWRPNLGHAELVRILLWEGKAEDAWREANAGGCTKDLWLQLAALRAEEHPEDALGIYQRQIAPTLDRTNNDAYEEAIGLLRQVHAIMVRLDRLEDFRRYVDSVRVEYKRKRNFIKLLDAARWR